MSVTAMSVSLAVHAPIAEPPVIGEVVATSLYCRVCGRSRKAIADPSSGEPVCSICLNPFTIGVGGNHDA